MTDIKQVLRRLQWFTDNWTLSRYWNIARLLLGYVTKSETSSAWPAVLKIDLSPACNLKCPVCVHAEPGENELLQIQDFGRKRMSVEQFSRLVAETKGKVSAFSLYYLGDPYMHPQVDTMCRVARDANINVHLSSNFSFKWTDERIEALATSGVTHLTVCVDGFSQETYGQTRLNGSIDYVRSNLSRLCAYRKQHHLKFPRIEVQFIKFNHNVHEAEQALAWLTEIGVDHVESYWGMVNNYSELEPHNYTVGGPLPPQRLPRCYWPFTSMTIKYDGRVIPCCNFRHATQYVDGVDDRALGNVFEQGIKEIWNSREMQKARLMIADPQSHAAGAEAERHFCYGCPAIYSSDYSKNVREAPDFPVEHILKPMKWSKNL